MVTHTATSTTSGRLGHDGFSGNLIFPHCLSAENDCSFGDSDVQKEPGSKKRFRIESCAPSSSKAKREKQRRDKMNDEFMELSALLDPRRPPKTFKAAILVDATRLVTQLRGEAQKLKDSNTELQEKIKELKAEKNELRGEKHRLKEDKEKLEQQLKKTNVQPAFLPGPDMPAAFASQAQAAASKFVPIISYHGVAIWQFMPPACCRYFTGSCATSACCLSWAVNPLEWWK